MREKSKIIFHMKPSKFETVLSSLQITAQISQDDTMQVINLFKDTLHYKRLFEWLTNHKIDFTEFTEIVYSKKEIDSAEFLRIIPNVYCGYPQPEDSYQDISYDLQSKCPKCSNGILQKAPLQMLKPQMGNNDVAGIHWIDELVITDKLKNLIEKESLSGFEIWPIIDAKRKIPCNGVYQLFIVGKMPPMSSKASIIRAEGIEPCECRKKGYMLKEIPIYNNNSLNNVKDFNKTFEWLGGLVETSQLIIVKKRIYDLFMNNKIKGVRFEPTKIIG